MIFVFGVFHVHSVSNFFHFDQSDHSHFCNKRNSLVLCAFLACLARTRSKHARIAAQRLFCSKFLLCLGAGTPRDGGLWHLQFSSRKGGGIMPDTSMKCFKRRNLEYKCKVFPLPLLSGSRTFGVSTAVKLSGWKGRAVLRARAGQ